MSKKILIYGENWLGTLPQLLLTDLKKRDLKVNIFDFTDILPGIKKRTFFQKLKRRLFGFYYKRLINSNFIKKIDNTRPEIIIVVKGLHIEKETLIKIKDLGIYLVNWNPDDFFNMKNSNANLIENMPFYDTIVSSREHLFDKYYSYGAKNMLFLDWYFVPELHYSEGRKTSIKHSFVGSWSKYREELIDSTGKSFTIRGGGWEKSSPSFKKRHDLEEKVLSQREMSILFESSVYNLNILTHENEDLSNLRFFEVPASGGLLVTERNEVSTRYLKDKKDCLMYSSIDELKEILDSNLDLDIITENGKKTILSGDHTFYHRITELLNHIEGCLNENIAEG